MSNAIIQDFTCKIVEGRDRYAEVVVHCCLLVDVPGIKIEYLKQPKIREAIRYAVEDAVTVEAPARKEAANE